MKYQEFASLITTCSRCGSREIRWCDQERFLVENSVGASPGEFLNRYQYAVVGTTVGGNAVVASVTDPAIYFADHTWYDDKQIYFCYLAGDREWHELEMNRANLRRSLYELAPDRASFLEKLSSGKIDMAVGEVD